MNKQRSRIAGTSAAAEVSVAITPLGDYEGCEEIGLTAAIAAFQPKLSVLAAALQEESCDYPKGKLLRIAKLHLKQSIHCPRHRLHDSTDLEVSPQAINPHETRIQDNEACLAIQLRGILLKENVTDPVRKRDDKA